MVADRKTNDNECHIHVFPRQICVAPGGRILWFVDGRNDDDWNKCTKTIKKIAMKNFKHGGIAGDPFDGNCDKKKPHPGHKLELFTECLIRTNTSGEDYQYGVFGLDDNENDITISDPEIIVRRGGPAPTPSPTTP
jgi:hypothetical protein